MDREKVIHAVKTAFDVWIDEYTGCSWFKEDEVRQAKEDALALLKEQEHKDRMYHALEDDWKRLKELLKEQEDEKPVLDEFGRCFLNALKRQLDMKLQMIELLITPEFAEKVVELIEKMFD